MNQAGLSLEQAPPIAVPLRFFLSAPLFALIAVALLAWHGPGLFSSRWNLPLLAATHLLTLGFLGMAMLGALMQMLPVIAGTAIRHPSRVATLTHGLVSLGVLMLAAGFALHHALLLKLALLFLGTGLAFFIAVVLANLRRALPSNVTARTMRLAIVGLLITATLGLILGSNHVSGWWIVRREIFTNLHLTWGMLGWVSMLVIGVAYQVVPMFQLTPAYPDRIKRWLAPALFGLLLTWSLIMLQDGGLTPTARFAAGLLPAAALTLFAVTTLRLQLQRRRKLPDVTLNFWRFGMASILIAALLWLASHFTPLDAASRINLLLGILMVTGFAMSVVNGMLYKIVPFLVWFHLQSLKLGWRNVPNMHQILSEKRMRPQMRLHFAAVALLLATALGIQPLAYLAALAFGASNLWLWLNLLHAYRIYRRLARNKPVTTEGAGQAGQ